MIVPPVSSSTGGNNSGCRRQAQLERKEQDEKIAEATSPVLARSPRPATIILSEAALGIGQTAKVLYDFFVDIMKPPKKPSAAAAVADTQLRPPNVNTREPVSEKELASLVGCLYGKQIKAHFHPVLSSLGQIVMVTEVMFHDFHRNVYTYQSPDIIMRAGNSIPGQNVADFVHAISQDLDPFTAKYITLFANQCSLAGECRGRIDLGWKLLPFEKCPEYQNLFPLPGDFGEAEAVEIMILAGRDTISIYITKLFLALVTPDMHTVVGSVGVKREILLPNIKGRLKEATRGLVEAFIANGPNGLPHAKENFRLSLEPYMRESTVQQLSDVIITKYLITLPPDEPVKAYEESVNKFINDTAIEVFSGISEETLTKIVADNLQVFDTYSKPYNDVFSLKRWSGNANVAKEYIQHFLELHADDEVEVVKASDHSEFTISKKFVDDMDRWTGAKVVNYQYVDKETWTPRSSADLYQRLLTDGVSVSDAKHLTTLLLQGIFLDNLCYITETHRLTAQPNVFIKIRVLENQMQLTLFLKSPTMLNMSNPEEPVRQGIAVKRFITIPRGKSTEEVQKMLTVSDTYSPMLENAQLDIWCDYMTKIEDDIRDVLYKTAMALAEINPRQPRQKTIMEATMVITTRVLEMASKEKAALGDLIGRAIETMAGRINFGATEAEIADIVTDNLGSLSRSLCKHLLSL